MIVEQTFHLDLKKIFRLFFIFGMDNERRGEIFLSIPNHISSFKSIAVDGGSVFNSPHDFLLHYGL